MPLHEYLALITLLCTPVLYHFFSCEKQFKTYQENNYSQKETPGLN